MASARRITQSCQAWSFWPSYYNLPVVTIPSVTQYWLHIIAISCDCGSSTSRPYLLANAVCQIINIYIYIYHRWCVIHNDIWNSHGWFMNNRFWNFHWGDMICLVATEHDALGRPCASWIIDDILNEVSIALPYSTETGWSGKCRLHQWVPDSLPNSKSKNMSEGPMKVAPQNQWPPGYIANHDQFNCIQHFTSI